MVLRIILKKNRAIRGCAIGASLLIVLIIFCRIFYINTAAPKPAEIIKFDEGEWIELGGSYINNAYNEMTNGYSIRVENAEILSIADYCKKYAITENSEELKSGYVMDVSMTLKNCDNSDGMLFVSEWRLIGSNKDYFAVMNPKLLMLSNSQISSMVTSLAIKKDTERSISIPFFLSAIESSQEISENMPFELAITRYPVENHIILRS